MASNLPLESKIGIGLRHPHYKQVIEELPAIGWFEVHSENFFHQGGAAISMLQRVRQHYPVSLHGVGLSLGSAAGLDPNHLTRLKQLIQLIDPCLVSEHLSWSRVGPVHMPDLLPVPYTAEALDIFCTNITQTQDFLGRQILIENPSSYLEYKASEQEEVDFLVTLAQRSGAKILLDINNIFVSCMNHGWDAQKYLAAIPLGLVGEIHLAGHSTKEIAQGQSVRVDTHDHAACQEVWDLYGLAVQRFGVVPTLLEWDAQIPELSFLMSEAAKALDYFPPHQRRAHG